MQALLQGIPMLNQHKGIEGPPAVDTIKLNLGTPAATENRFGVIGGDTAGYPNGRRLGDDVVDIELQVVAGLLKGNKVPLGDGVDRNDMPYLSTFPYLAAPQRIRLRTVEPRGARARSVTRLLAPLAVFGAVLVVMVALNSGATSPPAVSAERGPRLRRARQHLSRPRA